MLFRSRWRYRSAWAAIARAGPARGQVFITGILPVTMDDIASAYNVATYLTLDEKFEAMAGFTQSEVDHLLDEIYLDYELDPATHPEISALIKNHYDGYHFASHENEPLYNATSLMYFLSELTSYGRPPEFLTDLNLRTELHAASQRRWIGRCVESDRDLSAVRTIKAVLG